jgi:NAD(P)-dependent dehydrogenase (short-subunit alcohol dehydrogenase family)
MDLRRTGGPISAQIAKDGLVRTSKIYRGSQPPAVSPGFRQKGSNGMNGHRVVIVGGTSGLGYALAELAVTQGATVVLASRSQPAVDKAVGALGISASGRALDVTDESAVRDFFSATGPFDHLVYTAGEPLVNASLADTDISATRAFFATRYFGALTAVKYAAPHLRPGGSVTLTSGIASTRPQGGTVVVSSVLSAIEGLTRALAVELAPIRVNAVVPSIIRTEMWNGLPASAREDLYASVAASLPLGRVGDRRDIAEAYAFLMTNKHTTGTLLTIDGGAVLA